MFAVFQGVAFLASQSGGAFGYPSAIQAGDVAVLCLLKGR